MNRTVKKTLKIAGITLGVILLLLLILPFAFQGKLAKLVKEEGNKMLNAQFDFRTLNISLLRNFPSASVSLEDFWLKGTGPFENDTLIQAGEGYPRACNCAGRRTSQLGCHETIAGCGNSGRRNCTRDVPNQATETLSG